MQKDTILKLPRVKEISGLSRSEIYKRISEGSFPAQIKLSVRASGWIESEVYGWVQEQIAKNRPEKSHATGKTA